MGKAQRVRGGANEREVCADLSDALGRVVHRKLGQARDGGDDIEVKPFRIECKRRRKIAAYKWIEQVEVAVGARDGVRQIPVVVARADGEDSIAILKLADFIPLMRGEIVDPLVDDGALET